MKYFKFLQTLRNPLVSQISIPPIFLGSTSCPETGYFPNSLYRHPTNTTIPINNIGYILSLRL